VQAHHGFTGRYNASNPIYLQGTIQEATYSPPHARITISIPNTLTIPKDFLNNQNLLNDIGGHSLEDPLILKETLGRDVELIFPPGMTSELSNMEDKPVNGSELQTVVYRNCINGELRVQMALFENGESVVRDMVNQTQVETCENSSDETEKTSSVANNNAAEDRQKQTSNSFFWIFILLLLLIGGFAGYRLFKKK